MLDEVIVHAGDEHSWILSVPADAAQVLVELGQASSFVDFDQESSQFNITESENITSGDYLVKIEMSFGTSGTQVYHQVIQVVNERDQVGQEDSMFSF